MNRRILILICMLFCLVVISSCASTTQQIVPIATGPIPANSARIIVSRDSQIIGSAAPFSIMDNGKQIGTIGPSGQITWDRIAGSMQLTAFNTLADPEGKRGTSLHVCVGSGMNYNFRVYFPLMGYAPPLELVSGTPVACKQMDTASAGNIQQGQLSSVSTTASTAATAPPNTSMAPEVLQPFTGEIKIVEVKHFTQADGLGLSQEFMNSFYEGLCERLRKVQVAEQIIDEGSTVPADLTANTITIEGKFTEYYKGKYLTGIVGSEVKFYRKSDHALVKVITPKVLFKDSILNTDRGVGKGTGARTADEIKKFLK